MSYEKVKIITGEPKDVEKRVNAYFAAQNHPNARIISTALSVHTVQVVDEEAVKAADKAAEKARKEAEKAKKETPPDSGSDSKESEAPASTPLEAAVMAVPMKTLTIETMAVTVGLDFTP